MRHNRSTRLAACALLLTATFVAPLCAQDDAGETEKSFGFWIEIDAWQAKPVGMEFEPATRADPGSVAPPELLEIDQDNKTDGYYRVGFLLAPEVGDFVFSWYAQSQQNALDERSAGLFRYGEALAYPVFAGYENDGLADGFESRTDSGVSDLRFDYRRIAFRSDRITGRWFVGVRRVTHDRQMMADYFALSPNPPTVPPQSEPRPDLTPLPDEAMISSNFVGRGLEAGMDFHVPLAGKRFKFEAGFAVAALRGRIDSNYLSTNSLYIITDPVTGDSIIAPAPYSYFADTSPTGGLVVDDVTQELASIGLSSRSRSTVSPVIDLYLGLRVGVWKGLDLVAGWRSIYYGNVGVDLRPKVFTLTSTGDDGSFATNFVDVTEVDRSVEYQGAYLGISYTY